MPEDLKKIYSSNDIESHFLINAASIAAQEERCACGQLLAVLLDEGVEIKCKRCKRLFTIQFEKILDLLKRTKASKSLDSTWQKGGGSNPCQCHIIKEGITT